MKNRKMMQGQIESLAHEITVQDVLELLARKLIIDNQVVYNEMISAGEFTRADAPERATVDEYAGEHWSNLCEADEVGETGSISAALQNQIEIAYPTAKKR